jgi:excisionase family DNA binding protein
LAPAGISPFYGRVIVNDPNLNLTLGNVQDMTMTRPAWTLTEAAERTGVSRSTVRRYREAGKLPGAFKDSAGTWRFPLESLLAAGLKIVEPAQDERLTMPTEQGRPDAEQPTAELRLRILELEKELAVEQAHRAGLERLAEAAEANARDLRMALRMLEAGKAEPAQVERVGTPSEHAASVAVSSPEQPSRKRRWWWS